MKPGCLKTLLLIISCLISLSCGAPDLVLYTDRAEFAAYTEVFNAAQSEYWLQIVYHPSPSDILGRKADADLIVGTGLSDPSLFSSLRAVDRLFRDGRIDPQGFYRDLVDLGRKDDKHYVLPLNFNLPAAIYKPGAVQEDIPSMLIPLDDLKRIAAAYNSEEKAAFQTMGFSPLWYEPFLYYLSLLNGAGFRLNDGGLLTWNEDALSGSAEQGRVWLEEADGGYEAERAFSEKYRNAPEYHLLEEERILFYVDDIRGFLRIPPEKRESLEFRWLARDGRIPVAEDILFIGIPKSAGNNRGARFFLEWIFTPENQVILLESNYRKRLEGIFGIANGFSSLVEINQKDLPKPRYSPLFVGSIPSEEMLLFPRALPSEWERMKTEVVYPWLRDRATGAAEQKSLIDVLGSGN